MVIQVRPQLHKASAQDIAKAGFGWRNGEMYMGYHGICTIYLNSKLNVSIYPVWSKVVLRILMGHDFSLELVQAGPKVKVRVYIAM